MKIKAMNNKLCVLPKDLLLFILDYVEDEEKIEFSCCCKDWYTSWVKNLFRKIRIWHWNHETNTLNAKTKELISNSYHQLELVVNEKKLPSNLLDLLIDWNFSVKGLAGDEDRFLEIMKSTEILQVQKLMIKQISGTKQVLGFGNVVVSYKEFFDQFLKIADCQNLYLQFSQRRPSSDFPHLPSLKTLSIIEGIINSDILILYATTLHHLSLHNCSIVDVSMLGSIPHLELTYCSNVTDISALNNNEEVIIIGCDGVRDFSQSFANSRSIEVFLGSGGDHSFDLSRWRKVHNLKLRAFSSQTPIRFTDNQLPKMVRKCRLEGSFVSSLDFTVTSDHVLSEIQLLYNDFITSLEGYGLERIGVIECDRITYLRTLQGLGSGKNRKIVLRKCNLIVDFTPLKHVPILQIMHCDGFTDLSQLGPGQDLAIVPSKRISFCTDFIPHSLSLSNTYFISDFLGLERIPFLELDGWPYYMIEKFLTENSGLTNQRIVLLGSSVSVYNFRELLDLHTRFLQNQYDYHCRLPKRWTWTKKEKIDVE